MTVFVRIVRRTSSNITRVTKTIQNGALVLRTTEELYPIVDGNRVTQFVTQSRR